MYFRIRLNNWFSITLIINKLQIQFFRFAVSWQMVIYTYIDRL